MPGKGYVKVASVLLIISAVLSFIVYPVAGLLLGYATMETGENLGWIFVVVCLLYTVAAILQLMAGVKGMKGCNTKESTGDLKKWGKVVLVISIIAAIVNAVNSILKQDSLAISIVSILLSFVIPGLYIYGASLNEKA